ncbi:MAG: MFS transporter [Candidatus Thermoplasmatota archaeon]|nr:MFS transporter [Candidatus Thermoplasmatota archaeon]
MSTSRYNFSAAFQVLSAFSGWLMDGYVSIGYVIVAPILASIFFPSTFSHTYALLLIFLGLVVGAIARFIGSIILGNFLGDKLGRRKMLVYSIMGFSVSSFFIGFLPVYSQVSYLAPVLLYFILFIVGLFAGAEYSGGATLSMEAVPQKARLPVGAFVQSGYGVGFFIMLLVLAYLKSVFGIAQYDDLVWRVMFFTTIIPGIVALIIRLFTTESEVFVDMSEKNEIENVPAKGILKQIDSTVASFILLTGLLLLNNVTLSFYPTFLGDLYASLANSPLIDDYNAEINLISLVGVWIGGIVAYFIFRRKLTLGVYSVIFIVILYPIYLLTTSNTLFLTLAAFSAIAFVEAAIFSSIPAYLAEIFSKSHRTTAMGTIYNGAAIPASFGISAIYFISSFHSVSMSAAWFLIMVVSSILLILGIVLSSETGIGGKDPITK